VHGAMSDLTRTASRFHGRTGVAAWLPVVLPVLWLAAGTTPVAAQEESWEEYDDPELVYLTLDEGLAEVFAGADTLWIETWAPTPDERTAIERRLGWRLEEEFFTFHRALRDGDDLGWAVVTDQIGHHRLITFLVHVNPEGEVGSVHVMVYRESRGGEIRRQRFLRQYRGKDVDSHIRINRDIIGISGATLSVRAANASVRRVLNLIEARYLGGEEANRED